MGWWPTPRGGWQLRGLRARMHAISARSNPPTHTLATQMLEVRRTDDGKVELKSRGSSGWIYEEDIYACKGYIQAIGTALLP